MPALPAIDEKLFRFINLKLANPFFDVLMPFLSGNKLFGPAIVAIAALLIWRGGAKGRCYLLLLALLLSAGDPLVCNSFKNYFQRPRPFVTLPDARRPGKTPPSAMVETAPAPKPIAPVPANTPPGRTSYSMPSAHAFNWGAAAMITFLFYRRSWRFMLPLALSVAYSRVYNGVHYPGDVIAGLLLGSLYGFSGVVALNALWGRLGKKYFPLWWARVSNLVNPVVAPAPAVADARTVNLQWIRLGWLLIGAVFIARLFYLASGTILLSEDEAYQWLWSKHLALSYYSKPFGIALAQWIGTSLWGDTAFGVRFLSPVMAAVLGLALLHFLARHTSGRTAFFFVLICLATPMIAVGGIMITIDPLVVFFWTLAMLAAWNAITRDSTGWWIATGVGMSGAFLSKYISPFQWASFALFFLLCKPARAQLRRPGPWLALGINLLATAPVILWNQQHNWITMTHLKQRGDIGRAWQPTLKYFGEFLGAEFGLLNIIFAIAVLWAIVMFLRSDFKRCASAPPVVTLELFLLCQGIVVFGFYTLYTFHSRVQPNWIAAGVLPLFLFATLWWHRRWLSGDRKPSRLLASGLALGLPLVLFAHNTDLIGKLFHKPLPAKLDILHRVRGFDTMANIVGEQRQLLLAEGKPVFIIADNYSRAGELSFYLPEARPLVATDHPLITINKTDHPGNQLWFWPGYDFKNRTGQNAIYIDETDDALPPPEWLKAEFDNITDLGLFDINYRGRVYDRIQLFACRGKK